MTPQATKVRECYIIRDAYSYAHTSTRSTLVLTSSIYHWVRPYRPLSQKRRLHLIFDTNPRLGMIPKFFFKRYLQRNLTYSCNQNFLFFVRMCQISHYETLSTFLDKRASLKLLNSNWSYFYQLLSKAQLVTQVRGRPILIYKPKSPRL